MKYFIVFVAFFVGNIGFSNSCVAQTVNDIVIHNTFQSYAVENHQHRSFLQGKSNKNPLVYFSGALLFVYQNVVSEQIQASCQYETSCSENMKMQIKRKGLLRGILGGLNQLGACNDMVKDDYPAYKISVNQKINNTIE